MKPFTLIVCLFFMMSSKAQFGKKNLKSIEKNAVYLPVDTLIISQSSIGVGSNADSVFGKTVVSGQPGWPRYFVNLEGSSAPREIRDGTGFKHDMPHYIQNKVGGVYINAYEVSNKEYRAFVAWTSENQPEQLRSILLDSQGWNWPLSYGAPMMSYYHSHPAFDNYPVSNVSHQQARLYLEWLTEQYNSSPKRKYKKVVFRLPTEAEWMYAYIGQEGEYMATYRGYFRKDNGQITANFILYPPVTQLKLQDSTYLETTDTSLDFNWETHHHTSSKQDTLNYTLYHKSRVITLTYLNNGFSGGMYTTPVKSYWPNSIGIYNMAGNVAEFVAEEGIVKGGHWNTTGFYLKPTSRETYLGNPSSSPTRGFRWVMEIVEE